jgi:hypothetical protein
VRKNPSKKPRQKRRKKLTTTALSVPAFLSLSTVGDVGSIPSRENATFGELGALLPGKRLDRLASRAGRGVRVRVCRGVEGLLALFEVGVVWVLAEVGVVCAVEGLVV